MRKWTWLAAVLLSVPAAAQEENSYPTATTGDPHSLDSLFKFKPTEERLKRWGKSSVKWRFDIHPPPGTTIDPETYVGRDANILKLTDGRCFRAITSAAMELHPQVSIKAETCPVKQAGIDIASPDVSRPSLDYRGKVFNLSAWTNRRSEVTEFAGDDSSPVMATTMRVIAFGGGGSPDTPQTAVMIQGYAKDQLVLCMVSIIAP